jgi:hypothetical protein
VEGWLNGLNVLLFIQRRGYDKEKNKEKMKMLDLNFSHQ